MVVDLSELDLVAEAGGMPQGSPPRQAGEDRGAPRRGDSPRRDGGISPSQEDRAAREHLEERVQADEGRGQDVDEVAQER